MANYYFTFGSAEHFPYKRDNFVLIKATDIHDACATFRNSFPDHTEGVLNCADYYNEDDFNEFRDKYYPGKDPIEILESDKYLAMVNNIQNEDKEPELE